MLLIASLLLLCDLGVHRDAVEKQISRYAGKSYRKKLLKGWKARLWYTPLRERCQLDARELYRGNQLLLVFLLLGILALPMEALLRGTVAEIWLRGVVAVVLLLACGITGRSIVPFTKRTLSGKGISGIPAECLAALALLLQIANHIGVSLLLLPIGG